MAILGGLLWAGGFLAALDRGASMGRAIVWPALIGALLAPST